MMNENEKREWKKCFVFFEKNVLMFWLIDHDEIYWFISIAWIMLKQNVNFVYDEKRILFEWYDHQNFVDVHDLNIAITTWLINKSTY